MTTESGILQRTIRLRDKYELVELAGSGGMAEVFRSYTHGASGFRRTVAIKRIVEDLSHNPEFVAMFVEEARVVADLVHPNIVQVHDFDQDERGRYYLVMEWVEGLNLADWARAYRNAERPTPWPLVAAIGIEVLKGLAAAHERHDHQGQHVPIFHRDVTPHNILLSTTGVVKLADFGLARAMDRARITEPHILKGKLSYVAPELVSGNDPTMQSDLFGVGIVLWEALVGEKLFQGEGPLEVLTKVREARVPPLAERCPDLPADLVRVVHGSLAKMAHDRPRNARAMARSLANILRVTPASTSPDVLGRSVAEARSVLEEQKRQGRDSHAIDEGDYLSADDARLSEVGRG